MKRVSEYGPLTMTVGELIEELREFDPELPVLTEGCDCDGAAASVICHPAWSADSTDYVYIRREEEE